MIFSIFLKTPPMTAEQSPGQHLRPPETQVGENDDKDHYESLQAYKRDNSTIHFR
jgi:hypothetical protein